MSESIDCPYCSTQLNVTAQDDITKQYVRCTNCSGIFEYMPGFGTFSLPDRGMEFSQRLRSTSRVYPDELDSINQQQEQQGGCGGCCIVLIVLFIFLIINFNLFFFP
ncbi:MAG: hypothetical protein JW779_12170 [Candidatus Thorarchaeota archaeon]|nr:hypothetical protein [Candidatus Thorarchaeota archaeon]